MELKGVKNLEEALVKTESDAELALKAAMAVVSSIKKFRTAAKLGTLSELSRAIGIAEEAVALLKIQLSKAKESWDLDEDVYLSSDAFPLEILNAAKQAGVKIFQQDDRIYCYPFLIRILPNQRSILIDKTKEKRLRPSVLVKQLKELQSRPIRFKPEIFLECLFSAYKIGIGDDEKHASYTGIVFKLREIYRLLTLLPGQTKEYSIHEFARDVYLLDQSGVVRTKGGFCVSFPASTGTKSTTNLITVITKDGQEKKYYGISFRKG